MARPRKNLTEEQITQVTALAAFLTIDQIADYFGLSDKTLRNRMAEDPAVSTAYKKGKQRAIADVAGNVLSKARQGDNACMFFYLKTQAGWRETRGIEHSGQIQGGVMAVPIPIEPEQWAESAKRHQALITGG